MPFTTQLNSEQFYYSEEALSKGVKNSNLGIIQMIIQGYDLYSSKNNSTNSPTENKDNHYNATIRTAPNNVLFCLFNNNDYQEIFMNKNSDQIYFVKKDSNLNFLDKSCNIKKSGYFRDLLNK